MCGLPGGGALRNTSHSTEAVPRSAVQQNAGQPMHLGRTMRLSWDLGRTASVFHGPFSMISTEQTTPTDAPTFPRSPLCSASADPELSDMTTHHNAREVFGLVRT